MGLRELDGQGVGSAAPCDRGIIPARRRRIASSSGMPGTGMYGDSSARSVLENPIVIDVRVLIGWPGPLESIVCVISER